MLPFGTSLSLSSACRDINGSQRLKAKEHPIQDCHQEMASIKDHKNPSLGNILQTFLYPCLSSSPPPFALRFKLSFSACYPFLIAPLCGSIYYKYMNFPREMASTALFKYWFNS